MKENVLNGYMHREMFAKKKIKSNYLSTHTIIVKKPFNLALHFEILSVMFVTKKERKKYK
jgi:hypothetical protein